MKEISIRELHRRTGAWVRSARTYGSILVRDRRRPVARIVPAADEPEVNRFAAWQLSGPTDALLRKVHTAFTRLSSSVVVRSLDALHLVTARAEGFDRIHSNDRHLLGACRRFGLEGVDPTR